MEKLTWWNQGGERVAKREADEKRQENKRARIE